MSVSTPTRNKPTRNNRSILVGLIATLFLTVIAVAGSNWWNERSAPSQASKADCALAQKIVDDAQELPSGKAAVEEWWQSTGELRRSQMKDGFLSAQISIYEGWAFQHAKGEGTAPAEREVDQLTKKANTHCTDAGVKLAFPPIAS
ncbi:hypothetical protein [Streptomyces sp. 2A115]|uniref:hypothetical protein n=1 Tax=Streptomyces sp. 2A115 TaxID=3457439 RepID=UPI003FD05129